MFESMLINSNIFPLSRSYNQPLLLSEQSKGGYCQQFKVKGSGRNLKSNFGAFNTQWIFLSNWNPSLKYVSTFHFLTKLVEIFCGVNVDAKAAGTKF